MHRIVSAPTRLPTVAKVLAEREVITILDSWPAWNVSQSDADSTCALAGIRGVTRELLEELRKSDPKNPMLDKKIRDRIFISSFKNVSKQTAGTTYQQRKELNEKWRDES